ncbi:MAG: TIGR04086 family membrane protein [Nocardioidaceae bacterium]
MTSQSSGGASAAGDGSDGSESSDYETTDYGKRDTSIPVREEHVEPRETQVHEETVVRQRQRPVYGDNDSSPVNVAVGAERQDGVRWGPIWAGLLTALTTFILLELLFYAFGWLTLDPGSNQPGNTRWLVTGILALVAFFLGGLIAGATSIWKGLFSGLLHGFMVWALGVAAFIALTFFGGSALLGSFGSLAHQLGVGPQQVQKTAHVSKSEASQLSSTAKDAAGPAFWGLALPLASSMLGGLIGSKIWPRRSDSDPETVRLRS